MDTQDRRDPVCRRGLLIGVSPLTLVVLWGAQCLSSCPEESGSAEQGEWQLGMLQDPHRLRGISGSLAARGR